MKNVIRFIQGLIIGLITGSLIALLLAPEEGDKLRQKIINKYQEMSNQFKQAANLKKAEMEEEIQQYLKPK